MFHFHVKALLIDPISREFHRIDSCYKIPRRTIFHETCTGNVFSLAMTSLYCTSRAEKKESQQIHGLFETLRLCPHYFHFSLQLLQNLGKADKTTDEIFEEHLLNFNQQQANATRLQKDISNYIRCIKGT